MITDLTVGKPQKILWKFCLPLFGSVIFQQLYNIADSLIAGKFIGENALAAVGNSYELTLIFIALAFGSNIGCSVIVSRFFGAKRYKDLKTAVYTTWISVGILCLTLMILGFIFTPTLLMLIKTPEEIFADSVLYMNIYIGGVFFLFFYNIATGIFSAIGDSKTPFIFLAFSSTANIFMDWYFVTAFDMGVAGVAWATFICQGISCILSMLVVIKRLKQIPTEGKITFFSLPILKQLLAVAIPSMLQQSFVSVGNIVIQSIINGYGSAVVAGYAAAVKLNNLSTSSFVTFGNGISNYASQNLGAGKTERIGEGFKAGIKMVYAVALPLTVIYFFLSGILVTFFMDNGSAEAISTGVTFLKIVAPFYAVISIKLIADGILRGVGEMNKFMAATFTDLIIRVVLAFIFSGIFKVSNAIWLAWPIGWTIATILSVVYYKQWKMKMIK